MKTDKTYIATQSPMINTAEDFWRMVWEQQSKVILMLNPLNDSGKVRIHYENLSMQYTEILKVLKNENF